MFKETIFIKTNKYDNLTFFEHKVLIHNYTTGIMDTDSNANSDAKEPDTSTESKLRESKNQGRGVKSSRYNPENYTDTAQQQNVSRSSETPEDLETDMSDVQIGQAISSPGKGKFSFLNSFSVTSSALKEKGKTRNGERQVNSWNSGKDRDFL